MLKIGQRKVCASLRKLATLLETRITANKSTSHIRIQSIAVAKMLCQMY